MLKAFISETGEIVPFHQIVLVSPYSPTRVVLRTLDGKTNDFCFKNEEANNQQLANFKTWLTTKTNSI